MSEASRKARLRLGYAVFGALVGIKIVEYLVAVIVRRDSWPYLAVLAMVSAWLILYFYKHIHQLWRPGDKDGE